MNQISQQISSLVQCALDGEESAAKAYAILKEAQSQIESGLKLIKDGALEEAREFNKDEVYYGGKWEIRNTATYLDFSKDENYKDLADKLSKRKLALNNAFKSSQEGAFYVTSDGEEIPVLPVKTPSSQTLVFKFK